MYQLPRLARMSGLVHGISTSKEGNQGFGYGLKGEVITNRGTFLRKLSRAFYIRSGIAMVPFQPGHEETICVVSERDAGWGMTEPFTDLIEPAKRLAKTGEALILPWREECRQRTFISEFDEDPETLPAWANIYLFLAIGDCFPLILYAPAKRVLALVHLSRESSVRRMALRTVEHLEQYFNVNPSQIFAGIGPGIRTYVLEWFERVNEPEWQEFVRIEEGGVKVDLLGFNVHLLKRAGVREENIEVSEVDTFTDTRFASRHRSKATGEPEWRHACAVGMVPVE